MDTLKVELPYVPFAIIHVKNVLDQIRRNAQNVHLVIIEAFLIMENVFAK